MSLHHFAHGTCVGLLRKIRASLAPGGQVLGVAFVPNADRVTPAPLPATFAFVMLGSTPSGDAYTATEFDTMAKAAGARGATVTPLPPSPQSLVRFEV